MEHTNKDKHKYNQQKANAKARGVEFKLTFQEWWGWWQATGHYHERGKGAGKYVMARHNDAGPYELGNIYACTQEVNAVHAHKGKKLPEAVKEKMRNRVFTEEHRAKLRGPKSAAHKAILADHCRKMVEIRKEKNNKE